MRSAARLAAAIREAVRAAGNPYVGDDVDLARTWDAVDETTGNVSYFRNVYEVRQAVYRRLNHAAVEGAEYRAVAPVLEVRDGGD